MSKIKVNVVGLAFLEKSDGGWRIVMPTDNDHTCKVSAESSAGVELFNWGALRDAERIIQMSVASSSDGAGKGDLKQFIDLRAPYFYDQKNIEPIEPLPGGTVDLVVESAEIKPGDAGLLPKHINYIVISDDWVLLGKCSDFALNTGLEIEFDGEETVTFSTSAEGKEPFEANSRTGDIFVTVDNDCATPVNDFDLYKTLFRYKPNWEHFEACSPGFRGQP